MSFPWFSGGANAENEAEVEIQDAGRKVFQNMRDECRFHSFSGAQMPKMRSKFKFKIVGLKFYKIYLRHIVRQNSKKYTKLFLCFQSTAVGSPL